MTNQPCRYPFFSPTGSYLKVRREGSTVIVEQGDLMPYRLTSFVYGKESNPLQQAAQLTIAEKDPLIIEEAGEDFSVIDEEDSN